MSTTDETLHRIRDDYPAWLPCIDACLRAADEGRKNGLADGQFSGSVVVTLYLGGAVPNLRPLVKWGLLERIDQSRRNTYYRFADEQGVRRAMRELQGAC